MINVKKMKKYLFSNKKTAVIFFTTAFLVVVVDIYTAVTFSILATFVINIITISKVKTRSTITDDKKLVISVEGTILSHSFNHIQRHFNKKFNPKIQEVVFDIRNASLRTEDIINFDWITLHEKNGVNVSFLYEQTMDKNIKKLFQLNPEISNFNLNQHNNNQSPPSS